VGLVVFVTAMAGISYQYTEAMRTQKQTVRDGLLRMALAAELFRSGPKTWPEVSEQVQSRMTVFSRDPR